MTKPVREDASSLTFDIHHSFVIRHFRIRHFNAVYEAVPNNGTVPILL